MYTLKLHPAVPAVWLEERFHGATARDVALAVRRQPADATGRRPSRYCGVWRNDKFYCVCDGDDDRCHVHNSWNGLQVRPQLEPRTAD